MVTPQIHFIIFQIRFDLICNRPIVFTRGLPEVSLIKIVEYFKNLRYDNSVQSKMYFMVRKGVCGQKISHFYLGLMLNLAVITSAGAQDIFFNTPLQVFQRDETVFMHLLRQFDDGFNMSKNKNLLQKAQNPQDLIKANYVVGTTQLPNTRSNNTSELKEITGIEYLDLAELAVTHGQYFDQNVFMFLYKYYDYGYMRDNMLELGDLATITSPDEVRGSVFSKNTRQLLEQYGLVKFVINTGGHYVAAQIFRFKDKTVALLRDSVMGPYSSYNDENPSPFFKMFAKYIRDNWGEDTEVRNIPAQKDGRVLVQGVGQACGIYTLTYLSKGGLMDRVQALWQAMYGGILEKYPQQDMSDPEFLANYSYKVISGNLPFLHQQNLLLDFPQSLWRRSSIGNWLDFSYSAPKRPNHKIHQFKTGFGVNLLPVVHDEKLGVVLEKLEAVFGVAHVRTFNSLEEWRLNTTDILFGLHSQLKFLKYLQMDMALNYAFSTNILDISSMMITPMVWASSPITELKHKTHNLSLHSGLGFQGGILKNRIQFMGKVYYSRILCHLLPDKSNIFDSTRYDDYLTPTAELVWHFSPDFELAIAGRHNWHVMSTRGNDTQLQQRTTMQVILRMFGVLWLEGNYRLEKSRNNFSDKFEDIHNPGLSIGFFKQF
jgi:hypothetical protein